MHSTIKEVVYRHLATAGTSYDIGRMEGEFIKQYHRSDIDFFIQGNEFIRPASAEQVERTIKLFDKYCPHLNDEIRGLADSIGVEPKKIIYYSFPNISSGNCGHFAVLPGKTADGHFYVGRSYEWSIDDELRLMTTKAKGLYGSIGFSLLLFGRYEGINEHGLCVTMSNGAPGKQFDQEGLGFWTVIRILLDTCRTVDEALKLIEELPISAYCNLIIADSTNQAALAEISNSTKRYRRISTEQQTSYICSTNHYTLEGMQGCVFNRMKQSVDRYDAASSVLAGKEKLEKEELRRLLSQHTPEGLCCHYYEEGLGTLWSMLFDITDRRAEICFGSPRLNSWYTFDFDSTPGVTEYKAQLPLEGANPQEWARV